MYQDFFNDKNKFDFSDYPEESPYFDKRNKKVIGKLKDEASGITITEFIGLRSKMYSYIKDNDKGGKTAKGIYKAKGRILQIKISNMKTLNKLYLITDECIIQ